jgi:hypothetical protein
MSPASYQTAPPRDGLSRAPVRARDPLTNQGATANVRAGNGTRTRDPNLGKVVLYQLSYSRIDQRTANLGRIAPAGNRRPILPGRRPGAGPGSGGEGACPEPQDPPRIIPRKWRRGSLPRASGSTPHHSAEVEAREPAPSLRIHPASFRGSGGEGDRTPDLVNAIHALSQLSYAPVVPRLGRPAPEPR